MAYFRYKSLKSWKIDNIDLTQQFSLSIFTDFRYQSIKITVWLLQIFLDTDFYRLTTPENIINPIQTVRGFWDPPTAIQARIHTGARLTENFKALRKSAVVDALYLETCFSWALNFIRRILYFFRIHLLPAVKLRECINQWSSIRQTFVFV